MELQRNSNGCNTEHKKNKAGNEKERKENKNGLIWNNQVNPHIITIF